MSKYLKGEKPYPSLTVKAIDTLILDKLVFVFCMQRIFSLLFSAVLLLSLAF